MQMRHLHRALRFISLLSRLAGSMLKETAVKLIHNTMIQERYPGFRCHFSCEIIVRGRLTVEGQVNVGRRSRIIIEEGCHLVLKGDNYILDDVLISPGQQMIIGKGVSIQDGCILLGYVHIGSYCLLAPRVFASSGMHAFKGIGKLPPWVMIRLQDKLQPTEEESILVDSDCWIGINSVLLPGCQLAQGMIVGAGSIVKGSYRSPYCVIAGAPARCIGKRWVYERMQIASTED